MSGSLHISALLIANALNLPVVEAAIDALYRGRDPYAIEGMAPRSSERQANPGELQNCMPTLSEDSTAQYIRADFRCEDGEGVNNRWAIFSLTQDGRVSLYLDPLPSALGPTDAALAADGLPGERRLLNRLRSAVRKGEDPSLSGIIPLNALQVSELEALADCRWDRAREANIGEQAWFIFVRCDHHEGDTGRMVELRSDDDGRPMTVRVTFGAMVKR